MTMGNIDNLKSTGLKATLPRLKILEIFQAGGLRHMTAEDVFKALLAEGSDIGLATVYRVLTQFEQAGIEIVPGYEGRGDAGLFGEVRHDPALEFLQRDLVALPRIGLQPGGVPFALDHREADIDVGHQPWVM